MENYNVMAYRFTKPSNTYDRKLDLSKDCHKGEPTLPSGLSDVSKCYNGKNTITKYFQMNMITVFIFRSTNGCVVSSFHVRQ